MFLTKEEVRAQLPRVGDKRMEVPTITVEKGDSRTPKHCVVVEVNHDHFWYTVQFEDGFRESYKLPKVGGGRR